MKWPGGPPRAEAKKKKMKMKMKNQIAGLSAAGGSKRK
jgi:hypothetical protein